jgi:hypothetical protein
MLSNLPFREVWAVDFEFGGQPGEPPDVVCLVARELLGGREVRQWRDEMGGAPPYSTGADSLFVAYYASAEIGCHLARGWPVPERVLDLYAEFRNLTNGTKKTGGAGLLGALTHFGIDGIGTTEKSEMRDLVLRGGPWTDEERAAILTYCASDVAALARLLPAMLPDIDLPRALLRGRYMAAAARVEANGVPLDLPLLQGLRQHWDEIQDQLIAEIDQDYGVYEGRTFKAARFEAFLVHNNIPWPRIESGRLSLEDGTFREMARAYPNVAPLHELRATLGRMRLSDLEVGRDGRNRRILSAFQSRTGRNQPSSSRFVFGPATWLRGLIKPPPGHGVAYIDWQQQEFGIAAALSGDQRMLEAYRSGDPYLAFAKQAKAVPQDATKSSHKEARELFKACVLAVQYGMGADALAQRIGRSPFQARELLRLHREAYFTFWQWSDRAVDHAMLGNPLATAFGWQVRVSGDDANARSLRNFPMQANGAEMLRLACCLGTERGIEICAPVHDAVLICAPLDRLGHDVATMQDAMREASREVLGGFELGTDAAIVRFPDRYMDPRGRVMWGRIMKLLNEQQRTAA